MDLAILFIINALVVFKISTSVNLGMPYIFDGIVITVIKYVTRFKGELSNLEMYGSGSLLLEAVLVVELGFLNCLVNCYVA